MILMKANEINLETGEIEPVQYADTADVERFARTKRAIHGPSTLNFKIDLSAPRSSWNKRAATIFSQSFIESNRYNSTDVEEIKATFLTHVKHLRNKALEGQNDDEEYSQEKRDTALQKARMARRLNVSPQVLYEDI